MSAVKQPPRWVYAIGGIAIILLYPALRWVDFYFSARAMFAAAAEMAFRADALASAMSDRRMLCSRKSAPGGVTPRQLASLHADFTLATFPYDEPIMAEKAYAVYRMIRWGSGLTSGVGAYMRAEDDLDHYIGPIDGYADFCGGMIDRFSTDEELESSQRAALEPQGDALLKAHAKRIRELRANMTNALEANARRNALFAAVSWSVLIFEVVGMGCVTAMVRWSWRSRHEHS
jgi:hypothetical protein